MKTPKSLLDRALGITSAEKDTKDVREKCELAIAFIEKRVSGPQASAAMGGGPRGAYYSKLGTALLTGARRGVIRIELLEVK